MNVVSAHGKYNPYLVVYLYEGRVYVVTHRSVAQLVSYKLDLGKHRMIRGGEVLKTDKCISCNKNIIMFDLIYSSGFL